MSKEKINEGLIDRLFGVLEKGLKKSREKATARAMKDPKVPRKFKKLKKDIDELVASM